MHKRYDKDYRAKVVLEVICGEKAVLEVVAADSVHPYLMNQLKKQLLERVGKLFEKEGKDRAAGSGCTEGRQALQVDRPAPGRK